MKTHEHPCTTLAACRVGTGYRIVALPDDDTLRRRLHNLGLDEGKIVHKISGQFFKGPVVIRTKGTELAIGHGMAVRIKVEPAHPE